MNLNIYLIDCLFFIDLLHTFQKINLMENIPLGHTEIIFKVFKVNPTLVEIIQNMGIFKLR